MVGPSPPDEEMPGGGIEIERRVVGVVVLGPCQSGIAALHDDEKVRLAETPEPYVKVGVGVGVLIAASGEEDSAELTDRVFDEVLLAEQLEACVVVACDVPAVQGVFVS